MSGFAVALCRDGSPVDRAAAEPVLAALAHRGPDGSRSVVLPSAFVGHQHFRTTREEAGESQPLSDAAAGLHLVFDGRIDNRDELLAALGDGGIAPSDAALVLRAYARWGDACFARILGPFAAVIVDERQGRVVAARDPLGSRTLFHHVTPRLALFASEESALLRHPAVPGDVDETTLAHYFAVSTPGDGSTFFTAVKEVQPGHLLVVERDGVRSHRYYVPDLARRVRYRDDRDYVERFRELLAASVRARLRTVGPCGVMLSGGMDSPSIAALAASRGPLKSFSWIFDDPAACDERRFIGPIVRKLGLDATYVPGDDLWPLRDAESWPVDPSAPYSNPYRLLKREIYRAAAGQGVRTLLNGAYSDSYYSGAEDWLTDLVREGRLEEARSDLALLAERRGWRPLADPAIRRFGSHLLPRRLHPAPRRRPWLTEHAARLVSGRNAPDPLAARARRPSQYASLFSPFQALSPREAFHANGCGVEIRDPYRDLRLVEFALAIPAHLLQRVGRSKRILRDAMAGLLPDEVVTRTVETPLGPLYRKGLLEREAETVRSLLESRDAPWRRFVSSEWLAETFPGRISTAPDGPDLLVPWLCATFVLWLPNVLPD